MGFIQQDRNYAPFKDRDELIPAGLTFLHRYSFAVEKASVYLSQLYGWHYVTLYASLL